MLIATGVATLTGLGIAGAATAAPDVTGVEITKTGTSRLEVDVETLRGSVATRPRISVTIKRSLGRARVVGWGAALRPGDTVQSTARLTRVRVAAGSSVIVRVRACDSSCGTVTRTVTVLAADPATADPESGALTPDTPLPADAIDAAAAVEVALARVGSGSTLIEVERGDEYGAAWEVKVRRADGARVKVYVGASGSVLRVRVDAGDDDEAPAPLPPGSVTAEQAAAIAEEAVGAGSTAIRVEREDDSGVAWEVKVESADGTLHEVKIAPDGTVVSDEEDD